MQKNWCFWTVVLEKTLESPLDCTEIQPVNPKGNQPWIFIGRTNVEAETPILWPPDAKNWFIWNDPDAGKDWRWEEKGMAKDEIVGWHHRLNGHEFEQALGVGDGQGSLGWCSPLGCKESDTTERLNWSDLTAAAAAAAAMVFPVVIYGCEIWTIKKAECWRIDAFVLGVGEDYWESLGLQGDQTSQS